MKIDREIRRRSAKAAEFRLLVAGVDRALEMLNYIEEIGDRTHQAVPAAVKTARWQRGQVVRWLLEFDTRKRECACMQRRLSVGLERFKNFLCGGDCHA